MTVGPRSVYSGIWPKVRAGVLERDGYVCQIRLPKVCTHKATQVDHIVAIEQGGAPYDDRNLRAACQPCNVTLRNRAHNAEGWRRARTRITLVHGPPGAGKSTYVAEHKGPGDLVVDYDLIAQALGSDVTHGHDDDLHAAVQASRNALLTKLRRGEVAADRAWIVSANPKALAIFPHHDAVLLDPGRDEVLTRVAAAGRPGRWSALVDEWYAAGVSGGSSRPW
jgi:hypothetical protein